MVQRVTRRRFIQATSVAFATVWIVAHNWPVESSSQVSEGPADLTRTLGTDGVAQIGAAYLTATRQPQTVGSLTVAIAGAQRRARRWPWSKLPSIPSVIIAEFEKGQTVLADGWLLAETEARLCALTYLMRTATAPTPPRPRAH